MRKVLVCGNKFHTEIVCANLNDAATIKFSPFCYLTKWDVFAFVFLLLKNNEIFWIYPAIYSKARLLFFIWLPILLGKKVNFLWIGTDVLTLKMRIKDKFTRSLIKVFQKLRHFCVASWLQDELCQCGVEAKAGPYLIFSSLFQKENSPSAFGDTNELVVLSYVPASRKNFYGIDKILDLAREMPEVKFKLVAISKNDLDCKTPDNVTCLGFCKQEEMHAIYKQAHVFLRLTIHDGLPYSVLEALSHGLYVGFSYEYPFTQHIQTQKDCIVFLRGLNDKFNKKILTPNFSGIRFVKESFIDKDQAKQYLLQEVFL